MSADSVNNPPIPIALALVWKHQDLLIAKRLAHAHQGGLWEFPGGRIESLESADMAAVREVGEETGVLCTPVGLRMSFCYEYPERKIVFHAIDCVWLSGEPHTFESLDPRWVNQIEIRDFEFPPANRQLLLDLQNRWGHPA